MKRTPVFVALLLLALAGTAVAQSATLLAKYPEVLKVLREDPDATAEMAKAAAKARELGLIDDGEVADE